MNQIDINNILEEHKEFFHTGATKTLQFRLEQLRKLKDGIQRYEKRIIKALHQDLGKSEFEAYVTEVGFLLDSINNTMKNLKKWMKPEKVKTPFTLWPAKSFIMKEPYGTVLIIGPYNYPFQLLIEPLIGVIATGNCAVLKPSENTPHITSVVNELISELFDKSYVRVIEGEKETTSTLIHAPFDYIFFTGSVQVGKIVMEAAAKNLVPVTLELGGKSPVIVDKTANIDLAAKRIVWGKLLNTGQTCIAPDYMMVHSDVKEELISKMKETIVNYYGENSMQSKDYGRIVNERQFDRLASIIEQDKENVIFGGTSVKENLYIEPTLLEAKSWSDAAMQDEIFGPILPILEYNQLEEAIQTINKRPKPLALYLFTEDKQCEEEVLSRLSFGGGCINDTIFHSANSHLPFGGVGNAGIGAYHGKYSVDLFSHHKSIVKKSTKMDVSFVMPPYSEKKMDFIRKFLK
ncbi:aldehyde dehydrogenase [Bacillus cereus group sp. TH43LC]|uniref:aldehyde dehydrogenase n=1 Tax=Bacillus cereus group TaxID=86661 RepID=UPI00187B0049|nr:MULTISPECIES: aldehyde dehydrogenase [Bacillus cereus group]MBE7145132.1 aldehyde dehydrogenase [Bacillus paranthracis]MDA1501954.1 aldehyde dehydrogenase [Bacillus cereus group sp. TH43LC]MDA1788211.1 aldehyde dehydrogenase [Bacillus cereus group sp. BY5-1LC]MDA1866452.1 aldehyde dehydrogenase [Bacillus cereus group sp. BY128LC]